MSCKLGIAILKVRDLERAKRFYAEVVELTVVEAASEPHFIVLATAGDSLLGLQEASAEAESFAPGGFELGLEVEDVDLTFAKWQAKGAQLLTSPQNLPFGRAFDARDPEGYQLSVYQPPAR